MKRFLFSVLISAGLMILYLLTASIVVVINDYDPATAGLVDLPLRLPKLVYFSLFPPTAADYQIYSSRQFVLALVFFTINIMIYSIPIYLLSGLIFKQRQTARIDKGPPAPPNFHG